MSFLRLVLVAWAIIGSSASFLFLGFLIIGLAFFDPADDAQVESSTTDLIVGYAGTAIVVISIAMGVLVGLKTRWLDDVALLGIGAFIFLCGTASSIVGGFVLWPVAFVFLIGGLCRAIRVRVVPRLQHSG
jgi:hypothetical protein